MRAFIAVELPEEIRQEVASLQADLRAAGADVKWVEPVNLHLTLKFLGDIEEAQVGSLKEALRSSTLHLPPFTVSLEGIGAFPKTTFPRVIWVGVSQGKEELELLAQKVEEATNSLGFPKEERPFSAHLTIGRVAAAKGGRTTNPSWRVRSASGLAGLIKKLQVAEFCGSSPALIDRLILFQSTLSPKGPTYTPQGTLHLGTL